MKWLRIKQTLLRAMYLSLVLAFLLPQLYTDRSIVQAAAPAPQTPVETAENRQAPCIPVDVILLIDQTEFARKADPGDMRYNAAAWLANLLGYDRIYTCPQSNHRLAVIDLSGKELIPLTPLSPAPGSSPALWTSRVETLFKERQPSTSNSRDYRVAFQQAAEILERSALPPGTVQKQVIIMIGADQGIPCTVNSPCSLEELKRGYYQQIIDDIQKTLPVTENGPFVHVLAFDQFDSDLEKYGYKPYAKNIEIVTNEFKGSYTLIKEPFDLAQELTNIYQVYNGNPEMKWVSPGNLYIDPFLQDMVFFIFKKNASQQVTFTPPSAVTGDMRQVQPETPNVEKHVTPYVFLHPVPGAWNLTAGNEDLIYSLPIRLRDTGHNKVLQRQQPTNHLRQYKVGEALSDPQQPNFLVFKLLDNMEKPLLQYEGYPAQISGEISAPDGRKYDLEFKFADGLYTSINSLPVYVDGTYKWKVELAHEAADPRNEEELELVKDSGEYSVDPVQSISAVIQKPGTEQTLHGTLFSGYLLKGITLPVDVSVRLVPNEAPDTDFPEEQGDFFADPGQALQIKVIEVATGETRTAPLTPKINDETTFTARVGSDLTAGGEYLLSVENLTEPNPAYRWIKPAEPKSLVRKDKPLTTPSVYLTVFGILIAILLGLALYVRHALTNHVQGSLAFYYPGASEPFAAFPLFQLHRRNVTHKMDKKSGANPLIHFIRGINAHMEKNTGRASVEANLITDARLEPVKVNLMDTSEKSFPAGKPPQDNLEHELDHGIYIRYHAVKKPVVPPSQEN